MVLPIVPFLSCCACLVHTACFFLHLTIVLLVAIPIAQLFSLQLCDSFVSPH